MKRSLFQVTGLVIALVCGLLVPGLGRGASPGADSAPPPGRITLEACITRALERNLSLMKAALGVKAQEARARSTFKAMLPTLSTDYSYTGRRDANTVTIEGQSFPISGHDNYAWDLVVSQPLFQGGALWNRYRAARLDADMSGKQLEQVQKDLVRQVKEGYYGILKTQRIQEESQAAVDRLASHLEVARGLYESGLIAKNDLLQSEVELAQARQTLISSKHDVALAKARLNVLLRQGLDTPIAPAGSLDFHPATLNLRDLEQRAQGQRPEIQAGRLAIRKARREAGAVKGAYWPRVDLTGTYQKVGITPDMSDNPYGDRDMAQVAVSATWELWAWGRTRDDVQAATATMAQAETALADVRDQVALEVKEAWLRLQEAQDNVRVAETALAQAEENYRLNTERYRSQLATSTDVLDAQALLTRSRTSYFNAIADHLIAKAKLAYAVGD